MNPTPALPQLLTPPLNLYLMRNTSPRINNLLTSTLQLSYRDKDI